MSLPVASSSILFHQSVESNRVEYKEKGVLEPVIHTICAFANDIENEDGGYILLGVKAKDGMPILPISGLNKNEMDDIQKQIFRYCHYIEPFYYPIIEPCEYQGRSYLTIYVPAGSDRPYKARIRLDGNSKDTAYYIRHGSLTVVAKENEIRRLYDIASSIPFDDRDCPYASVDDLDPELMKQHLKTVGSDLYALADQKSVFDLAQGMRLVGGVKEHPMPKNVGVLMFSKKVNDVFPYARIDVVDLPSPDGQGMQETTFQGPLQSQLINALSYIQNHWISEQFYKPENKSKTLHLYNYPFLAIKELLANAVYHRDYRIQEPITVTRTPAYLEIKSFPGLDAEFSDENIEQLHLNGTSEYRNRRIGQFLKELGLTEGRNTGIPMAERACRENQSPLPYFLLSPNRVSTVVRIPISPLFRSSTAPTAIRKHAKKRSRDEIKMAILTELTRSDLSGREIASRLGYSSFPDVLRACLKELVDAKQIRIIGAGRGAKYHLIRS